MVAELGMKAINPVTLRKLSTLRALQGTCLTYEQVQTASMRLLEKELGILEKPSVDEVITTLLQMARENDITSDAAKSYIAKVASADLDKLAPFRGQKTKGSSVPRPKGNHWFGRGEQKDAVIKSIVRGNRRHSVIAQDLAERHGHSMSSAFLDTIGAALSYMTKTGVLLKEGRGRNALYTVLEFDSKEQAGMKDFTSKKEMEALH